MAGKERRLQQLHLRAAYLAGAIRHVPGDVLGVSVCTVVDHGESLHFGELR